MIRRPPRSTQSRSSAASDVYKRQGVIYAVFFVFIALVPHILYDLHRPPTDYGLWYPMISIGYFFGNYFVTRRGARFGLERLIQWGVIGQAVAAIAGLIWMSLGFWGSFWIFLAPALMAIGQGLAMPATTALGVARAPKDAGAVSYTHLTLPTIYSV